MQTSLTKHRIAKTFLTFQRYQAISDLFQAFSHLAYYPKKKAGSEVDWDYVYT